MAHASDRSRRGSGPTPRSSWSAEPCADAVAAMTHDFNASVDSAVSAYEATLAPKSGSGGGGSFGGGGFSGGGGGGGGGGGSW